MHNTPSRIRPAFLGQIILRLDDAGKVLGRYRVAAIGEDDPSGGPAPAPMPPHNNRSAWLDVERNGEWKPGIGMALRPGDVLDLTCRDGMVIGTFHFEDAE